MPAGTRNALIPGCGFHHISIQTLDLDASIDFYCRVLGMQMRLEFEVNGRRLALLDCGDGSYVELQAPRSDSGALHPADNPAPLVHFALASRDTRAAIERARQAGCTVTVEPREVNLAGQLPAVVAFFTGPNGETVEFFQEQ